MTGISMPPETTMPSAVSAGHFRDLMRHVASAVTIIASGRIGDRSGLTATAVCSISDQPPTLLICINRTAATHAIIASTGAFSVNVIAATDREVATQFSGRTGATGERKFDAGNWTALETGSPILTTALASFDCTVDAMNDVATHTIVLGRVVAGRVGPVGSPLLYTHGNYWSPQL